MRCGAVRCGAVRCGAVRPRRGGGGHGGRRALWHWVFSLLPALALGPALALAAQLGSEPGLGSASSSVRVRGPARRGLELEGARPGWREREPVPTRRVCLRGVRRGCCCCCCSYAPESIVSACPSATQRLLEAAPRMATVSSTGVARPAARGTATRSIARQRMRSIIKAACKKVKILCTCPIQNRRPRHHKGVSV